MRAISLTTGKRVPVLACAMERTTHFIILFSYLQHCTKSEDNFIANRKLTICHNINILDRLWENDILFHCNINTLFSFDVFM